MKTMFKIISICSILIVLLFSIDVHYTRKKCVTPMNNSNSVSAYEKIFIHGEDVGYIVRKNPNKSLVTYKLDNGRWISKEFWNNELKMMMGADDTTKIVHISLNEN